MCNIAVSLKLLTTLSGILLVIPKSTSQMTRSRKDMIPKRLHPESTIPKELYRKEHHPEWTLSRKVGYSWYGLIFFKPKSYFSCIFLGSCPFWIVSFWDSVLSSSRLFGMVCIRHGVLSGPCPFGMESRYLLPDTKIKNSYLLIWHLMHRHRN